MPRKIGRNYLPEQVLRLAHVEERIRYAHDRVDELRQSIVLDLIDGWSTYDPVLDFALVACDAHYDVDVIAQYRSLLDLAYTHAGRELLVVQYAMYEYQRSFMQLRTIYYARLDQGAVELDLNIQCMRIPVKQPSVVYQSLAKNAYVASGVANDDHGHITVGPLFTQYSGQTYAERTTAGIAQVPTRAPCHVFVYPWSMGALSAHEIDEAMLRRLKIAWLKARSP